MALPGVPFDAANGDDPERGGRVLDESGAPIPGLYAAGWIKRGPTGVIGTNKKDAVETVDLLLEDARARCPRAAGAGEPLEELLAERGVEAVMYPGWEAIDTLERAPRRAAGPPADEALHAGTSCSQPPAASSCGTISTLSAPFQGQALERAIAAHWRGIGTPERG